MTKQMPNQSMLLFGQLADEPKQATVMYDAKGNPIYQCPECKNIASANDCDCIGAEPDCLFCNECNREFRC